jgi:hypothetical protein
MNKGTDYENNPLTPEEISEDISGTYKDQTVNKIIYLISFFYYIFLYFYFNYLITFFKNFYSINNKIYI